MSNPSPFAALQPSAASAFGQPQQQQATGFGQGQQQQQSAFGQPGQQPQSAFGQPQQQQNAFGQPQQQQNAFGQPQQQQGAFGQPQQQQQGAFGQPQQQQQGAFGQPQQQPQNAFGQPQQQQQNAFGQPQQQQQGAFGQPQQQPQNAFGQAQQQPQNAFGQPQQQAQNAFGQPQQQTQSAFGQPQQQPQTATNAFGQPQQQQQTAANPFGQPQEQQSATNAFGQAQQQPQTAANAFGQPQQQQSAVNAFGQAQQQSQQVVAPSTFASLSSQQPLPGSGAFGAPPGQLPLGGNTGPGLGQAQQQQSQQAAPSPFASLTTQQGHPGSGAFGAPPGQPPLGGNTGSGFGQQQSAPTNPFGSMGLKPATAGFGGGMPNQAAQGPSLGNQGPAGTVNKPTQGGTTGYFDALLAKSKKRANGEASLEDLPSIQFGLGDLRQKLRKLGPGSQDALSRAKAQSMLAASGVDPGASVRELSYFDARAGRTEKAVRPAATDVDVDTYMAKLQEKTTLSMIADSMERSVKDFGNFLEDNVETEWEAQRKRIYEHFGIRPKDNGVGLDAGTSGKESIGGFGRRKEKSTHARSTMAGAKTSGLGRTALQKSVIGPPSKIGLHQSEFVDVEKATETDGAAPVSLFVAREKQENLAHRIKELNDARLEKRPFPVLYKLAQVQGKCSSKHAASVVDAYRAVMVMVGENAEAETVANKATARERQFARAYLSPDAKSAGALEIRKRILKGACEFLEKQFCQEVDKVILKHRQDAQVGGVPDIVHKMRAYIRVRIQRKDLVADNATLQTTTGNDPVWAIIFFLLRSGHVAEAAEYVKTQATTFRTIDRAFPSYLLEYAASEDRRLRRNMQERCANEYSQRAHMAPSNSIDPFRMACYKIVGRCEVNKRSFPDDMQTQIHDWVWLQFNLARETDRTTEVASEAYNLSDLQATLREVGQKHFPKAPSEADDNSQHGMFFFLQVLSGMFEQAIAYLYPFSYVDAIHFAIALEYYGLLRPTNPWTNTNELLSYTSREEAQINFGRMLGHYTRDFRAANAAWAVDYLTLICLNSDLEGEAGKEQTELCHTALRELVLETRDYSQLLGDIKHDGRRISGLIEERGPLMGLRGEDEFMKSVTLTAARYADENGRTTDAVLLFHLAGDYDSVVSIVSRALSEAIALDLGQEPMRLVPVKPRLNGKGKEVEVEPGNSLSLAGIDDPIQLAKSMMSIYEKHAMFTTKIHPQTRAACRLLLAIADTKSLVEQQLWPECLDRLRGLDILPLETEGSLGKIRAYAAKFAALPQAVSINVPNLLMWAITSCIEQRKILNSGPFNVNEGSRRMQFDQLRQISVDLATYVSQLKYRFPPVLHRALALACAE